MSERARALRVATCLAGFAGGALLLVPSCASIIGADDYDSVAEVLCQCPEVSEIPDCVARLEAALAGADAKQREAWFNNFQRFRCDESCAEATACFDTQLTCSIDLCSTSAECCGAASPEQDFSESYCSAGQCARDPVDCKETGQACEVDDECCGSGATNEKGEKLGICLNGPFGGKICGERCNPQNPANCPGCCTQGKLLGAGIGVCLSDKNNLLTSQGFSCAVACTVNEDCEGSETCRECTSSPDGGEGGGPDVEAISIYRCVSGGPAPCILGD